MVLIVMPHMQIRQIYFIGTISVSDAVPPEKTGHKLQFINYDL